MPIHGGTSIAKKVRFVLAASAAGVLLGACLSSPASKPASGALDKYWESTGKTYPAGGKLAKPMAFAPGQYVVTGSAANGKRQSVTKTLLVRKEQGGWVFETVGLDAKGKEPVVDAKAAVPGGPISVPAGSFAETVLSRATTKVLGFAVETESWMSAAAPINGMVKSRPTDGKSVVEFLSFGFGGKPVLQ